MDLVTPQIGLMFWTLVTFILLLVLLKAFAWKPILAALKEREESIDQALKSAEKAREDVSNIKSENEKILQEAKEERASIDRNAQMEIARLRDNASDIRRQGRNAKSEAYTSGVVNALATYYASKKPDEPDTTIADKATSGKYDYSKFKTS